MKTVSIIVILLILLIGCNNNNNLNYHIVKDETRRDIKRVVDVVLDEYISESQLKKIALEIKNQDNKDYERTFIGYFIKSANKDFGYWATTNFNPTLKIHIMGLTVENKITLMTKPQSTLNKKILGSWIDNESPMLVNRVTLFTLDKKLYLEKVYSDNSLRNKLVTKEIDKNGLLKINFIDKTSDYYIINKQNELEFWNQEGHYYSAKSL